MYLILLVAYSIYVYSIVCYMYASMLLYFTVCYLYSTVLVFVWSWTPMGQFCFTSWPSNCQLVNKHKIKQQTRNHSFDFDFGVFDFVAHNVAPTPTMSRQCRADVAPCSFANHLLKIHRPHRKQLNNFAFRKLCSEVQTCSIFSNVCITKQFDAS